MEVISLLKSRRLVAPIEKEASTTLAAQGVNGQPLFPGKGIQETPI
nr:hypothetical protein Iba_scaffold41555CG0340 [Ipomoea batatas]